MSSLTKEDLTKQIDLLTSDSVVYLTSATTESILKQAIDSNLFSNQKAVVEFVALCIISSFTNKRATIEHLQSEKFVNVRPFISSKFMIQNSINNNALSQAGLCFLTMKMLANTKVGAAWRSKYGLNDPWDDKEMSARVSEEQRKILKQKISRFTREEAKKFCDDFTAHAGLSRGTSVIGDNK